MGLTGPSRTVIVEPRKDPDPAKEPAPAKPEKVPAGA